MILWLGSATSSKTSVCSDPPALCNCSINQDTIITLSCAQDDSEDDVVIKLIYDLKSLLGPALLLTCENVPSFKFIPDLTVYSKTTFVVLKDCWVPRNESISQLTSKISRKINHLHLTFQRKNRTFNLDEKYFEGLSSLEAFSMGIFKTTINITKNVFVNNVNLTTLTLQNIPLPIGIFDVLENLQDLGSFKHGN